MTDPQVRATMPGGGGAGATIHVWTVGLDTDAARVGVLLDSLSGEERIRAARLRTTELRVRFTVAHGALRHILAGYLGIRPDQVTYAASALGKPGLVGSDLAFNLSHSDNVALCAVTSRGRLGVDVERIRPVADAEGIVKRYFAPGEAQRYLACAEPERSSVFFSTWTRKEAFLKANGMGLQQALDSFEVDVTPHETAPRLTLTGGAADTDAGFFLRSFTPRPQFMAAVALDRPIEAVEFFEWSLEAQARRAMHTLREMLIV